MLNIGRLILLVHDYDEAIAFYTEALGFETFIDIDAGETRFVHLRLRAQPDFALWLMRAETADQEDRVGRQTGGLPLAVIYTNNLYGEYQQLQRRGVEFSQPPQEEPGAVMARFLDLYGNEFMLVELREAA